MSIQDQVPHSSLLHPRHACLHCSSSFQSKPLLSTLHNWKLMLVPLAFEKIVYRLKRLFVMRLTSSSLLSFLFLPNMPLRQTSHIEIPKSAGTFFPLPFLDSYFLITFLKLIVLVFYYCVINYHKYNNFKITTLLSHCSVG
jgi:hypothetical protein